MLFHLLYFICWLAIKTDGKSLTAENLQSAYLSSKLVTLNETLKPFTEADSWLQQYVDISYSTAPDVVGMTKDESAAIKIYTAGYGTYYPLNKALRSEQLDQIQPWFPYLKLFHTAIMKIPPQKGRYCRGEREDRSASYVVGSNMTWWGVTSLSTKLSVCQIFLKYGLTPNNTYDYLGTLFWVESSSARPIKQFSFFQTEEEFILLPTTMVKTIAKPIDPEHKYLGVVEVKEMIPVSISHNRTLSNTKSPGKNKRKFKYLLNRALRLYKQY